MQRKPMPGSMIVLGFNVARRAGVDRAAAFALTSRAWQLLAAPLTMLVIASQFSAELQGYYYAFISLLALQSFAELGLSVVIVNIASHEWSLLTLDGSGALVGDRSAFSRLVGLGRLVFVWYAVAALIFMVVVGPVGFWFFGTAEESLVEWQGPWTVLVVLTSLQLSMLAFTALLEGCNQVETVQKYRVVQSIASTGAFWVAALNGAGLWAAVVIVAARLGVDGVLVAIRYRRFFASFIPVPSGPSISWRDEVWPMQWRLGVSGVVNYFAFSLFTPVIFAFHGAIEAGRMGMTLQLVGGVQALAVVFLATRVPQFGMLVAKRDYVTLDPMWRRASATSLTVMAVGGGVVIALVTAVSAAHLPLAARVLDPLPTGMLVGAVFLLQISQCQTAYIRAHRKELIAMMSVTTSLAIGVLVWLLGRPFGSEGALGGYLAIAGVVVAWETMILRKFRSAIRMGRS